ncbi:MAG: hypothetical protein MUC88_02740 [Planctomycetes bacterium]|nr:hypothetical protein [Planctomycetota bacterium]
MIVQRCRMKKRSILIAGLLAGAWTWGILGSARAAEGGRTFFVSSTAGADSADGRTPQSPWRSLEKVNAAELQPGDRVLFQRGGRWRGTLIPRSGGAGAPITYGAYGEGTRPLLRGSVSRNDPCDWHQEVGDIWATAAPAAIDLGLPGNLAVSSWSVHTEGGAQVRTTVTPGAGETPAFLQLECTAGGDRTNHIQLIASRLALKEGDGYVLGFRVRCTRPFAIPQLALMKPTSPWTRYGDGGSHPIDVGTGWSEHQVRFRAARTAGDGRITVFLGGALPSGSVFSFQPVSWTWLPRDASAELAVDVGNLIFDDGRAVGVKKWQPEDLRQDGDYWYSGDTWQVKLYSQGNPAQHYRSIELALRRHIIDQGNKSHVVYESLALHGGAAHGIGGGNAHHIVVRDCDVAWIGGGHQHTTPAGRPVRFGNGIEFWDSAHDNLVEGCRIWEVYDAALTNQGSANNTQADITYRDNVIWNCEYSFEYWNRGPESTTRNIRFERNTCVNAGGGWGHGQRPDRNGRHLMFYVNSARTTDFHVVGNIFCNATDSGLRVENDWTAGLTQDYNCWWQPRGTLMLFLRKAFLPAQFAAFQQQTHLDAHSVVADPGFLNTADLDFRLASHSPAHTLTSDSAPTGSGKRLER